MFKRIFLCNLSDQWSISFILKSFYQIPLTWSKTYLGWPISPDRQARFLALRDVIAKSDYDVILLQEVWYRSDHKLLRTARPYSTYFGSFNSG